MGWPTRHSRATASSAGLVATWCDSLAYVGESTLMPDPEAAHSSSANASNRRAKAGSVRRCRLWSTWSESGMPTGLSSRVDVMPLLPPEAPLLGRRRIFPRRDWLDSPCSANSRAVSWYRERFQSVDGALSIGR